MLALAAVDDPAYPSTHVIEVPASLAHRLSQEQLEKLNKFASEHADARKDVVALEHAMEQGESFETALAALYKRKADELKALPQKTGDGTATGASAQQRSRENGHGNNPQNVAK